MTESRKIFISHGHSDAVALKLLKNKLEQKPLGLQCFLAHHDIAPGEHDLNRIEKEVKSCDALVYVCNKNSKESVFCQQEIGMAKGLNKKIITIRMDKCLPEGFIGRIQAICHRQIDVELCEKVYWTLQREIPPPKQIKRHLDALGIKGFSRGDEKDVISVMDDNEEDSNFRTTFRLQLNEDLVGFAKIGYINQMYGTKTHDRLPKFFTHLDLPFFSYVTINDSFISTSKQAKSLYKLLNHLEIMPKAMKKKIDAEPVKRDSLTKFLVISNV